jgi:hypothetical protein
MPLLERVALTGDPLTKQTRHLADGRTHASRAGATSDLQPTFSVHPTGLAGAAPCAGR